VDTDLLEITTQGNIQHVAEPDKRCSVDSYTSKLMCPGYMVLDQSAVSTFCCSLINHFSIIAWWYTLWNTVKPFLFFNQRHQKSKLHWFSEFLVFESLRIFVTIHTL